jgi:hypothetical protein
MGDTVESLSEHGFCIPAEVKIGSTTFSIAGSGEALFDDMGRRLLGFINNDDEMIFYYVNMTESQKAHTLLHEVIHGIDFFLEIGLSEEQTERLMKGLLMVFQDNPDFVEYIACVR